MLATFKTAHFVLVKHRSKGLLLGLNSSLKTVTTTERYAVNDKRPKHDTALSIVQQHKSKQQTQNEVRCDRLPAQPKRDAVQKYKNEQQTDEVRSLASRNLIQRRLKQERDNNATNSSGTFVRRSTRSSTIMFRACVNASKANKKKWKQQNTLLTAYNEYKKKKNLPYWCKTRRRYRCTAVVHFFGTQIC